MKKIYLIMHNYVVKCLGTYEYEEVMCAFTDKKEAEEYVKKWNRPCLDRSESGKSVYGNLRVQEIELNSVSLDKDVFEGTFVEKIRSQYLSERDWMDMREVTYEPIAKKSSLILEKRIVGDRKLTSYGANGNSWFPFYALSDEQAIKIFRKINFKKLDYNYYADCVFVTVEDYFKLKPFLLKYGIAFENKTSNIDGYFVFELLNREHNDLIEFEMLCTQIEKGELK